MPRLLLALLMTALLCLRGGLGDAMALQMLAQHAGHGPALSSMDAHGTHEAATAQAAQQQDMPCHGAADDATGAPLHALHAPAPAHDGDAAQHGCETCGACQVCHGSAIALGSLPALAPAAHPTAPPLLDARFASADPVLRHKPPIS